MKPFEEQFTAWVDGKLTGPELAAFEKELEQHPDAMADRVAAQKLGSLLRQNPGAPKLTNPDFFNLQIQQRIAADQPRSTASGASSPAPFWSFSRLIFAGAGCLLAAGLMYQALIPSGGDSVGNENAPYFAQVLESWTSDPGIYANTVYNPQDNVTVLWLDGLDYIPASHQLK